METHDNPENPEPRSVKKKRVDQLYDELAEKVEKLPPDRIEALKDELEDASEEPDDTGGDHR